MHCCGTTVWLHKSSAEEGYLGSIDDRANKRLLAVVPFVQLHRFSPIMKEIEA
jgi:hypothetical protein